MTTNEGSENSSVLEPASRAEIAHAVSRVKARYFRHLDCKEWDALRTLFVDDAEYDLRDDMVSLGLDAERGLSRGADAFVARVSRLLESVTTVHHGHMPEIDVIDDSHARAIWAMEDYLEFPDGRITRGAGHYHEEYVRQGGEWRIARMRLTRLWIRHEPPPEAGTAPSSTSG